MHDYKSFRFKDMAVSICGTCMLLVELLYLEIVGFSRLSYDGSEL